MALLELTKNEIRTLETILLERIGNPCDDCDYLDCLVYKRGLCITKNAENILSKIEKIKEKN